MSAAVPTVNISFSGKKASYVAGDEGDADGDTQLGDGKATTPISLAYFRQSGYIDGHTVPASGPISISANFRGRTFGPESSDDY